MDLEAKVIRDSKLIPWRDELKKANRRLVVTNGCFDLLHLGHVSYLHEARKLGDALLVGINSDEAVRKLKGAGRPINNENDRALVLAALESVTGVFIFQGISATDFLAASRPDIYVKGGDYTEDQLPLEERLTVKSNGGIIRVLNLVPGRSTTKLVERIESK